MIGLILILEEFMSSPLLFLLKVTELLFSSFLSKSLYFTKIIRIIIIYMTETKISIVIIFIIIMFNKNVFYFYMSINELRSFLFCFLYLNIQFVLLVILCFQIHLVSLSIFSLDKFDLS